MHKMWKTPIVTTVKPIGYIHICANYKCTLKKALQNHTYPVPIVSHIVTMLVGPRSLKKWTLRKPTNNYWWMQPSPMTKP